MPLRCLVPMHGSGQGSPVGMQAFLHIWARDNRTCNRYIQGCRGSWAQNQITASNGNAREPLGLYTTNAACNGSTRIAQNKGPNCQTDCKWGSQQSLNTTKQVHFVEPCLSVAGCRRRSHKLLVEQATSLHLIREACLKKNRWKHWKVRL